MTGCAPLESPALAPRASSAKTTLKVLLVALILTGFALRNLPWHLDDYDQAKQAFVSYEMVNDGAWLYQHTPDGKVATKPPLAGWVSAGLYGITRSWDFAWRAPSFLAALSLLFLLWREGGWLAAAAFGLNPFAQRLATLVRTDMMLALWLFLAGWLLARKIAAGGVWTNRQRRLFALAVLASMLTKGPVIFAFLLPGYVLCLVLLKQRENWKDAAMWLLPLLPFAAWIAAGIATSSAFHEQVVLKEFLARFDGGANAVHDPKPVYTYVTKLVPMFFPWSLALFAVPFLPGLRRRIKASPELVWLACWIIGGLAVMSLVPSKRADRIFPIIPPACLLLARLLPSLRRASVTIPGLVALAIAGNLGYSAWNAVRNYCTRQDGLVAFGARSRELACQIGEPLALVRCRDEGMLLYAHRTRTLSAAAARREWRQGRIRAAILPEEEWITHRNDYARAEVLAASPAIPHKQARYVFISAPRAP